MRQHKAHEGEDFTAFFQVMLRFKSCIIIFKRNVVLAIEKVVCICAALSASVSVAPLSDSSATEVLGVFCKYKASISLEGCQCCDMKWYDTVEPPFSAVCGDAGVFLPGSLAQDRLEVEFLRRPLPRGGWHGSSLPPIEQRPQSIMARCPACTISNRNIRIVTT